MWVVDNRSLHTDWVEVVLGVQVVEAYVPRVVVEDTVDILDLLAVEDSFEEGTVDARSVGLLAGDEDYKSTIQNIYLSQC